MARASRRRGLFGLRERGKPRAAPSQQQGRWRVPRDGAGFFGLRERGKPRARRRHNNRGDGVGPATARFLFARTGQAPRALPGCSEAQSGDETIGPPRIPLRFMRATSQRGLLRIVSVRVARTAGTSSLNCATLHQYPQVLINPLLIRGITVDRLRKRKLRTAWPLRDQKMKYFDLDHTSPPERPYAGLSSPCFRIAFNSPGNRALMSASRTVLRCSTPCLVV